MELKREEVREICRVTMGHLRVTIGHLRVTVGYLRVTVGHINSLLPVGRYINMDPYPTGLLISWT